eukprot:gnl/TRDRNA2_/TRDRNA2_92532_c1_seq1.p1 gnl/TRDRNA2_/TRDRNA2_92532_c1~~gnl/TRDRNA2_/TRDRNA2_92532_c1_seq1.p1  ORF type:complete len:230 (+),score=53.96 gnl/TRDRNA2_/TRDRNA2_92532_c1_seq1:89-778(+)
MQQQFLTLNETHGKTVISTCDETPEAEEALREPMPLQYTWVLWEQVVADGKTITYADATRKVTSFKTAQEFWSVWNGIPQPSELLEQKRIMREQSNGQQVPIDAIMIFREGISPEWEHPANAQGGHFQIQLKPNVGGGQIDEYFNNIVLGMIGGTIEPADMITGIRLVDKLSSKGANAIRIELWFTKYSDSSVSVLKKNMERCLATRLDGSQGTVPKPEMKTHGSLGKH